MIGDILDFLPRGSEFLLFISALSSVVTWWASNITHKQDIAKYFAWVGVSSMIALVVWIVGSS